MSNDTAPQKTPEKAPETSGPVHFSAPQIDALTHTDMMKMSPEALVDLLGGANCDARTQNTAKLIFGDMEDIKAGTAKPGETGVLVAKVMPQLIDPPKNGKPAGWNPVVDVDKNGVQDHELLAALVRAAQIAKAQGISLGNVKVEDLDCKELEPLGQKLIGHAPPKTGPKIC